MSTELYHATYLPRKPLSLRLKDLYNSKHIMEKDAYYCLNGTNPSHNGNSMSVKSRVPLSIITKNIRIILLIMLWIIPSVALAYALMTRMTQVLVSPDKPAADFNTTPNPQPNLGWEVEGAKIIAGETVVIFNASSSYDPDGTITEYIWDFGDGEKGNGMIVTHNKPGRYCAKLTVVDNGGNKGSKTKEIRVYAKPASEIYLVTENDGHFLKVFIIVKNVRDLYGWQAGLQFNPKALKCLVVEKGPSQPQEIYEAIHMYPEGLFFGSAGSTLWFEPEIDNENGIISPMSCTLLGDTAPVSGSGTLARITFEILSDQNYDLKLNNVILCTNDGEEIPVIVKQ
ncbi:MAG: PKD domain-containing protein [Candidatus Bathyarchaeia archaeon]